MLVFVVDVSEDITFVASSFAVVLYMLDATGSI
jgi:hypothetical protein